jgi:hypothetical protein
MLEQLHRQRCDLLPPFRKSSGDIGGDTAGAKRLLELVDLMGDARNAVLMAASILASSL